MQCSLCARSLGPKLPAHCPACARYSLYEPRAENIRALLGREASSREVENVISDSWRDDADKSATQTGRSYGVASRWDIKQVSATVRNLEGCHGEIQAQAEILKVEIQNARADISKLKSSLNHRREDFASVTHNIEARRKSTLESIEKSIKRTVYRAEQQHLKTAESRIFLCREAAKLYDLRQRRRRRGNTVKEEYVIGGVGIVDLRDLNNAPPTQITTSLTYVSQLLVLVSHYLSLQLPAEITLPHRDYPLPTLFPPSSSYTLRVVSFPGSASSQPSYTGSSSSRTTDTRPQPRPRPLFLDKPLPQLSKDDPAAYSLFIEGVTLLAWDVAWVCRTQGINIGAQSWDEVCALGKNLWQLLVATPNTGLLPPNIRKAYPSNDIEAVPTATPGINQPLNDALQDTTTPEPRTIILGYYSHGTAHSFLGGAEGTEFMRGWKLQGPMKIVDRLKSLLLGEMTGAEWEMLDEREWGEEGGDRGEAENGGGTSTDPKTEPVPMGSGKKPNREGHQKDDDDRHTKDHNDEPEDEINRQNMAKERDKNGGGTSGWTKLRPR